MTIKAKEKQEFTKRSFTLHLPSSKMIDIEMSQSMEKVARPVRVQEGGILLGTYFRPAYRKVMGPDKKPILTDIQLRGFRIKVVFSDGNILEARSVCKPPDEYTLHRAILAALDHLYKKDSGIALDKFEKGGKKALRDSKVMPKLTREDRDVITATCLRQGKPKRERKNKTEASPTSSED